MPWWGQFFKEQQVQGAEMTILQKSSKIPVLVFIVNISDGLLPA